MSTPSRLDPAALAGAFGIALDPERAARLKPMVDSLVERLARLSRALPEGAALPSETPPAGRD